MEAQQGAESTTTLQGPRNGAKPPRKTAALPCRATLRARTKAQPPREKATRAKRVNAAAISLRPRGGSVVGVWAHGLTEIKGQKSRQKSRLTSGRWEVVVLPSAVRFRGIASLHAPRWGRAFAPLRSGANSAPKALRPRPRSARQSLTNPQKVLTPPGGLRLESKNAPFWS